MGRIEMLRSCCLVTILCLAGPAMAEGEAPDCAALPELKSKSRQTFESQVLMTSLLVLQSQGEAEFTPKYSKPSSECVLERFDVANVAVVALYSPFEKGEATLHYRFRAGTAPEAREVLVIYDGVAGALAKKGQVFKVVEDRAGTISYYGVFRDQPTYAALKPMVMGILDGSAAPLATVRWPKGQKEPVMDAYDSKRLK
jgi:hypothetical protein